MVASSFVKLMVHSSNPDVNKHYMIRGSPNQLRKLMTTLLRRHNTGSRFVIWLEKLFVPLMIDMLMTSGGLGKKYCESEAKAKNKWPEQTNLPSYVWTPPLELMWNLIHLIFKPLHRSLSLSLSLYLSNDRTMWKHVKAPWVRAIYI